MGATLSSRRKPAANIGVHALSGVAGGYSPGKAPARQCMRIVTFGIGVSSSPVILHATFPAMFQKAW